jgi:hypothetical protein
LSGHVVARITNTGPDNAVVSGIFFGSGGATTGSGTAAFVKSDATTQGTWKGAYGADGYNVINDSVSYPSYVTVTPAGNIPYNWTVSAGEARALQKASVPNDRIAACWYSFSSMSIDLSFNDSNTHQVAFYLLDYEAVGRINRIDILDTSNNVLDTRTVSSFSLGQYWVWNMSGHVIVRITNTGPDNAVVSGIFFR